MKNTTKAWLFLSLFSLLFLLGGHALAGREGLVVGFALAFGLNTLLYFYSEIRLKTLFERAHLMEGQDPWGLLYITQKMATRAKIPTPQIYVANTPFYQALALGHSIQKGKIIVTEKLLREFTLPELESIVAYLVACIKKQDTLAFSIASLVTSSVLSLSHFIDARVAWLISDKRYKKIKNDQGGWVTQIITPLISLILKMIINPRNYYKTDQLALQWVENPKIYAQALWKLENLSQTVPASTSLSTAHMFIVSPLAKRSWSRHIQMQPQMKKRIMKIVGHYPI